MGLTLSGTGDGIVCPCDFECISAMRSEMCASMPVRIEKELQSFAITDPASQAAAMEAVK